MAVVGAFVAGMFSFGAGTAFLAGASATGGLSAFGAWTAGSAFASTLIGGLTVKLLTSVAASALSSALAHEPKQGGGITISTTVRGEQNPETITLGRYATGGQAIAAPYSHGKSNRYLTHIIELCSAPGARLARVMIGDDWVTLGDTPHPEYGAPVLGEHEGRIWVKYYDGTQTAADPMLRARYGTHPDRPWTVDMVGAGLCYAILTFCFDKKKLTQVPRYRFELQGIPVYDPRRDDTAGGTGPQRLANPSTWAASDNAAVLAWNIIRGIPLPGGEVYGGNIDAMSELPQAMWTTAMNRCDTQIDIAAGGTEAQYRAGLEIALDQPPADALEELLKACSATIADLGYGWGIIVGAPALPVYAFGDDDVIVSKPQELDPFPAIDATYNAVGARYPEPDELYETKEAPPRTNASLEAADAFGRRMADLSLPAVPYKRQVQRLMRAWIEDERRFRRHNISLPPDCAHVELTDTVTWTSARNGYATKGFSVHKIVEDPRTGLRTMSLRERDPGDYSWVPGYELPSVPTRPGTTPLSPDLVSGFSVAPLTIRDAGGIARRAGILATWDSDIIASGLRWQLRLAGQPGSLVSGSTMAVEAGALQLVEGILPATNYQMRADLIAERDTAWTPWLDVTTPNIRISPLDFDTTPPPVPTGLVLTSEITSEVGALNANWAMSTANDFAYYDVELTEAGGNPVYFQTPFATYRWTPVRPNVVFSARVRAVDRLGNRSNWCVAVAHTSARDTTPPAVPTGLKVTPGFSVFWVQWAANTEADLSHYEIYQSPATTNPAVGATATYSTRANMVNIEGLAEAATLNFWVRAIDTSGNKSGWTARASGTTSSIWAHVTDAATPTGLSLSTSMTGETATMVATWAAATNAASYELGITEAGGNEVLLPGNGLRYEWTSVAGKAFTVRIRAVNNVARPSAWSSVVTITAARDTVAPAVPTGLNVTGTFGAMWLEWDRNTEADLSYYEVISNASPAWGPPNGATGFAQPTATTFIHSGLAQGATLYYAIRAWDTSGNKSAWSTTVGSSTLADVDVTITNEDLVGLIDATSFASGLEPVAIHTGATLPAVKGTSTLMWNGKLYRWNPLPATGAPRYVANTDASDILGQLQAGQLGVDSVTAGTVAAGAVNARELAAAAVTASKVLIGLGQSMFPDSHLQDPALWSMTNGGVMMVADAAHGQGSIGSIYTPGTANNNWVWFAYALPSMPVVPGREYLVTYRAKREAVTDQALFWRTRLQLLWQGASKATMSNVYTTPLSVTTDDVATFSVTITAPAGAAYLRINGIQYQRVAGASCGGYLRGISVLERNAGELVVDGSIKANHLTTTEAVITGSAQIANAIIRDAHIQELSAGILKAGTALAGTITVSGSALSTIGSNAALGAQNPATRINAAETTIDPGKIRITGTTTLADWRKGGDETRMDGGALSADTVRINSLVIGSRGVNLSDTRFEANSPSTNRVTWTAGTVNWINDAGDPTATNVAGTTTGVAWLSGTLYIYWTKGASNLSASHTFATAAGGNNIILATYKGGIALNAEYGRTVTDGSEIRTGTVRAANLVQTEELITNSAQIKDLIVTDQHVTNLNAAKLIAGSTLTGSITVGGRAISSLGGDYLLDTIDEPWYKAGGAGSADSVPFSEVGVTGTRVMLLRENGRCETLSPNTIPFDSTKMYRVTFNLRRALVVAGTRGKVVVGVRTLDGDMVEVGARGLTYEQSDIPGSFTDYVFYIKGSGGTLSGGSTLRNPWTLLDTTRFLRPFVSHNRVDSGPEGNYRLIFNTAKIEVVETDAAGIVNVGETNIDPGKITITGTTTLADWRKGGDESRFDGGAISANTVKINALEVGARNITLTGIQFDHNNPSPDRVTWTAGAVRYINDAGDIASNTIAGTSTGVAWTSGILYIYWVKGASNLSTTTNQATAFGPNNVILATYQGGRWLDADYGRTTIDGPDIKTGSLTAAQFIKTQAVITEQAQIGAAVIGGIQIADGAITNPKISGVISSDNFVAGENGAGWAIGKGGNAEFNTIKIRRQLQVASGSVNIGGFTPLQSLDAGPGKVQMILTTPIAISEWLGAKRTYLANAGMTGTVTSGNTNNCYWGWTADVLPLTKWSGNQSLRIRLCFWSQFVTAVNECTVSWKLYEVS